MPQSVLAILTVTDRAVGVGSLVEVVLCHPQKNARPDIQTLLQRFLKWSVSGARTRTISPFSDLTVPDWVENRIKEGTLAGLRAAIQLDPANARLGAHFGRCLANRAVEKKTDADDSRRARAEADFQTRRALKLASDNDEVKKLRAEVVQLLKLPE